ncbi:Cyclic dehypoxanthine futalosine synthase [bioreactor metagenome]|uniref:Cyclic dehypoxanthine futalosine synthase n=1 Tax=bioreactor metagenome TaxID=1076179 RepID=A0A645FRI6_9ZZZZ
MIENLKMVAMSRIILNNVDHIQASWLTTGIAAAQLALNCGADDMGSVMIEENVVSSAGANFRLNPTQMQQVIREAGFEPWLRNQDYTPRQLAD